MSGAFGAAAVLAATGAAGTTGDCDVDGGMSLSSRGFLFLVDPFGRPGLRFNDSGCVAADLPLRDRVRYGDAQAQ